ncbi:MAG: sigma-70 family RNA polymerase sigma factor [Planctomycetes bacterium]|nr:sigma-70 family RNA polymerase sigma factor [Planctomycetota bacterium]
MSVTSASLLGRLHENTDPTAWQRLVELYSPLIRGWLRKHSVQDSDADDLVQEVLTVVLRRFPDFKHNQRAGAFRAWLRSITLNCTRDFWKANRIRPKAAGGTEFGAILDQTADPDNPLSQAWDREHDLHVTRKLLEMIEPQFTAKSWEAFRRLALEGAAADQVAKELGLTVNAVFIAKSRVLSKLREEAAGLIETNE